jgi:hypothetical protein
MDHSQATVLAWPMNAQVRRSGREIGMLQSWLECPRFGASHA